MTSRTSRRAGNHERPAPHDGARRTAGLLDALSLQLRRDTSADLYVLCAKLESLRHKLAGLTPAQRHEVDRAARPLRRSLRVLLEDAGRNELGGGAARRDLRTVLRSLRCIAERIGDPELAPLLEVHHARVDVAKLLRSCCAAFASVAAERDVAFELDADASLRAELDADKIQAVIANLIYNAVKHTPPLGRIRCCLRADAVGDDLVMSVEDSGPSLPAARAAAIFQRSRYLDREAAGLHALGLHLPLSRDLCTLHGGTLTVRNNDVAGVTFELRVPRTAPRGVRVARIALLTDDLAARVVDLARGELRAEAELGAGSTAAYQHDTRPLLLIVEDTRSLHRLLADHFRREYRVASAFDGEEGLAKAEMLRPDLILTDLIMPGGGGQALITALRRRPLLDTTPIVVLTTKDNPDDELALLEHDVQDVIHKPFLLPEVAARVRNLIASKRARDVLSELVDRRDADLVLLASTVVSQQHELQAALSEMQAARAVAEDASRVKSNFLRMMSHELKTPLTAMQLQLELLARDPDFGKSERLREGHTRIWRGSRRLLHLIDTMLEWARVESGRTRLHPERFDLVAVVNDVLRELSGQAQQKRLTMNVRMDDSLQRELVSDRRLITLVLVNLLGRAIQRTPAGAIEISIDQRGTRRRVAVKDGSLHRVAEESSPFEPTPATGGTPGLGLHVVRDIARATGADLSFEDSDSTGAVLTLTLTSLELETATHPRAVLGAN